MPTAIHITGLSKAYQLGGFGTGTISRDLERYWARLTGKADPFLKIGEVNDRTTRGASDIVWSLKDIALDIEQGDAVGIIGRNGAGKSTLLKILSRVTAPTTGRVNIKGRSASLLEVGTGFHPELSGRENIYLNGAILGMRKAEITRKFDEIVDFSGVARYVDTPVKRYSSGMYVRLAFAVAAHLEAEILMIDEVLAVGDAEFQKKCLGKMNDMTRAEGRTILFVSHNMGAVHKLCQKGIYLEHGRLQEYGQIGQVLEAYSAYKQDTPSEYHLPSPANSADVLGYLSRITILDTQGTATNELPVGAAWQIRISFTLTVAVRHVIIALGLSDPMDINVRTAWSAPQDLAAGDYEATFTEASLLLATGIYQLSVGLSSFEKPIQYAQHAAALNISSLTEPSLDKRIIRTSGTGILLNPMEVLIQKA